MIRAIVFEVHKHPKNCKMSERHEVYKPIAIRALERGDGIDKTFHLMKGFVNRRLIAKWSQEIGARAVRVRGKSAQRSRKAA